MRCYHPNVDPAKENENQDVGIRVTSRQGSILYYNGGNDFSRLIVDIFLSERTTNKILL